MSTIIRDRWWRYFRVKLLQSAMIVCIVTLLQGQALGLSNRPASMLLPCKAEQCKARRCEHPPIDLWPIEDITSQ